MMQDNYANHQINHMFFRLKVMGNDKSAEAVKNLGLTRSLFELDGQKGHLGLDWPSTIRISCIQSRPKSIQTKWRNLRRLVGLRH